MGYRSDGHIWLSKEAQEKLPDELKEDLKENWEVIQKDIWGFEEFKWYEFAYASIKSWEDFMNLCEEKNLKYEFVRIGEDYDDIDVLGTEPYSVFGIIRTIDIYLEEEE